MFPRKPEEGKANSAAGSYQGGKQHMRGEEVDGKRSNLNQEKPLRSPAVQKAQQRLNKALPHLLSRECCEQWGLCRTCHPPGMDTLYQPSPVGPLSPPQGQRSLVRCRLSLPQPGQKGWIDQIPTK